MKSVESHLEAHSSNPEMKKRKIVSELSDLV